MSTRAAQPTSLRLVSSGEELGKAEQKQEFIELRAKGHSYAKIAKRLKVSKSTLANWTFELEGEIAKLNVG